MLALTLNTVYRARRSLWVEDGVRKQTLLAVLLVNGRYQNPYSPYKLRD